MPNPPRRVKPELDEPSTFVKAPVLLVVFSRRRAASSSSGRSSSAGVPDSAGAPDSPSCRPWMGGAAAGRVYGGGGDGLVGRFYQQTAQTPEAAPACRAAHEPAAQERAVRPVGTSIRERMAMLFRERSCQDGALQAHDPKPIDGHGATYAASDQGDGAPGPACALEPPRSPMLRRGSSRYKTVSKVEDDGSAFLVE